MPQKLKRGTIEANSRENAIAKARRKYPNHVVVRLNEIKPVITKYTVILRPRRKWVK